MTKVMRIVVPFLLAGVAIAQNAGTAAQAATSTNAAAQAGSASAGMESGTTLDASLSKSLDAKKVKPGDPVEARVEHDVKSSGHVVVPKGAKLLGHVTQAQAREKGETQSALGIAFDHAVLKSGESIAFTGIIRAISAAPQASMDSQDEGISSVGPAGYSSPASGGLANAAGSAIGAAGNVANNGVGNVAAGASGATDATVGRTVNGAAGVSGSGGIASNARGISGLPGLQLDAAASTATNGTVIVSNSKNVHLDSGTRLLVQVTTQ